MKTNSISPLGLAALAALGSVPASASTILFADTFDRTNNTNLNADTTGKSGTLGALSWVEKVLGTASGNVEISTNRLNLNGGSATNLGHVPYVDHNFIGTSGVTTTITVSFDFISAGTGGSVRQLGFSIGNSKTELDGLTASSPYGDVAVSYDHANFLNPNSNSQQVQVYHNGTVQTSVVQSLTSGNTLSATFTFADMNAGTPINYTVFLGTTSLITGTSAWSGTNENYIGLFNTHGTSGSDNFIDNVAISVIPEPSATLLGSLGMLTLLRRRRSA